LQRKANQLPNVPGKGARRTRWAGPRPGADYLHRDLKKKKNKKKQNSIGRGGKRHWCLSGVKVELNSKARKGTGKGEKKRMLSGQEKKEDAPGNGKRPVQTEKKVTETGGGKEELKKRQTQGKTTHRREAST